jgi:hypothetical protein
MAELESKVIRSIESLGCRVTAADIVHHTGYSLAKVQLELNRLAFECAGMLEVSTQGVIVYVFPKHLARRIWREKLARAVVIFFKRAYRKIFLWFKFALGANLIFSLIFSYALGAITGLTEVLESAAQKPGEKRYNSKLVDEAWVHLTTVGFAEIDWNIVRAGAREFPYLQQCFLYLFGERNPNHKLAEKQWLTISSLIQRNSGVVTFEQLAPCLVQLPNRNGEERAAFQVLNRFQGHPEVTDDGSIVYAFPQLKDTSVRVQVKDKPNSEDNLWLEEKEWKHGEHGIVPTLVRMNFLLSLLLALLLNWSVAEADSLHGPIISYMVFGWLLVANAAILLILPHITKFHLWGENSRIRARNEQRKCLVDKLASAEVKAKIQSAQQFAEQSIRIESSDVVYSTSKDLLVQELDDLSMRANE